MKRFLAILLACVLMCPLISGCGGKKTVKIAIVKDSVGVAFAQMVAEAEQNSKDRKYKGTKFKFTVVDTHAEAEELLKSKKVDVITTTTTSAAKLYNATDGKYVLSAVVSYAPFYILESSVEPAVKLMKDIKKKTIYAKQKGSLSDIVLQQVLLNNRLDPKLNMTVEYFDTNAEVNNAFYNFEGTLCYVAEPAVTAIASQSEYTRVAIDVNAEWDKINPETPICYMGLVSNKKFAKKNTEQLNELLEKYKTSYEFMQGANLKELGEYCKKYGISGGMSSAASMGANAKPVVLTGNAMHTKTSAFFDIIFKENRDLFAQALPDDEFYFDITE